MSSFDLGETAIGIVRLCAVCCVASGGAGLAVAVFQVAFNAYAEVTVLRALLQLAMVPLGGYMLTLQAIPNMTWRIADLTRLVACVALLGAGCVGLVIGSVEMTLHYMPIELWRRMAFYAAAVGAGLVVAPFQIAKVKD